MLRLPSLDVHAHDDLRQGAVEGSVALVMTNSIADFGRRHASDGLVGLGCHPADPIAIATFRDASFERALQLAPFIGEVGLDRRSRVPLDAQRDVFDRVLAAQQRWPRIVSVHSVGAHTRVLAGLAARTTVGVILHWWQGTREETRRALALGCVLSICPRQLARVDLAQLPRDRVLVETDYPYGGRTRGPGDVSRVETALSLAWSASVDEVRAQLWATFAALVRATESESHYSPEVRSVLERA